MNSMTKKAWLPALAILITQSTPSAPQSASVEARGVRVPVPAGWSANDRLIAASGPIAMTNFGGAYTQGGFPPPDGAEIEITSVPAPPNLSTTSARNWPARTWLPCKSSRRVNSGIQATYTESLNPDTSLKTVVDYIPHGATLYKFYLTHWTGDRNEPALDATLANLVREAQLR